jgi:hypothetical protein
MDSWLNNIKYREHDEEILLTGVTRNRFSPLNTFELIGVNAYVVHALEHAKNV